MESELRVRGAAKSQQLYCPLTNWKHLKQAAATLSYNMANHLRYQLSQIHTFKGHCDSPTHSCITPWCPRRA